MAGFKSIKKVFDFYSSGVSFKDLEKLIKRDIPELYGFYVKRMKEPSAGATSLGRFLRFVKNLFVEFLEQLTPVRRLLYSISLLLFILAYMNNDWQLALFSFLLVSLLIAFELADKITAKGELEMAREIQSSLMPKVPPRHTHYDFSFTSETALEVGGDYYDFFNHNPSGDIQLIIGDISGKGMAAALRMVQVQTILRNLICDYYTPKELLIELNRNLKNVLTKGTFFTASSASINPEGIIKLCRAGHMPLIHYKKKLNECLKIIPKGIGIGLDRSNLFENALDEVEVKTECGDILFFYTDGIVECMNRNLTQYGEERLKQIILMNAERSPKEIQESIINNLNRFVDGSPFSDDLTMIVMKAK